jgi:hypothetical protein
MKASAEKTATLWADGGWIHVRTPYNVDFVNSLKAEIERSQRKWNPDMKIWMVDVGALDQLVEIAERYYKVNVVEQEAPKVLVSGDNPYSELLEGLPDDVLKKIYRLIAVECHPDRGNDGKLLSVANGAWGKIKKLRSMA